MENYFFSASTLSFYAESIKDLYDEAGTWPKDAVKITPRQYEDFRQGSPEGKVLSSSKNGRPAWKNYTQSIEDKLELVNQKINNCLKKLPLYSSPVDLGIATEEEEKSLDTYKTYLVQLSRCKKSLQEGKDSKIPTIPEGF